jgi:hypothetical protein
MLVADEIILRAFPGELLCELRAYLVRINIEQKEG